MYGEDVFKPLLSCTAVAPKQSRRNSPGRDPRNCRNVGRGNNFFNGKPGLNMADCQTELGEDLTMDIVLGLEELNGLASTHLGHALRLMAISFNSFVREEEEKSSIEIIGK